MLHNFLLTSQVIGVTYDAEEGAGMENERSIKKYVSASGVAVYRLPVESFPEHVTNCYLVLGEPITLIDTASGWENANELLAARFAELREDFGEPVGLCDIGRIILTHGHIDHLGGLNFVIEQSGAPVSIHGLDRSLVEHFKERLIVSSKNLHIFLERAGLSPEEIDNLVSMNKWSKDFFQPVKVDTVLRDGDVMDGRLKVHHAPGHCPGEVCLQLDDILFTGDHILNGVTPLQSPESITRYTGLGHYLDSLRKIRRIPGIRMGLGGHEGEIRDVAARIDTTLAFHDGRLNKVLDICREPKNVAQITEALFGKPQRYHALLAFLEAGAHVEYLYERGDLVVVNVDEVERDGNPVLRYQAV